MLILQILGSKTASLGAWVQMHEEGNINFPNHGIKGMANP